MSSLIFWKNWTKPSKTLWPFYIFLFLFALVFMAYSYFQGANGIISWERIQELKTIETTVHQFKLGPFELTIPADSFVIFEYLQGSDLHHNTTASYIFLLVLICCAITILSVITTLERFWFFVGMSLFILFVVSLRLDILLIFGQSNSFVPGGVLIFYIATAWYFNQLRPETNLLSRLAAFAILTLITSLMILAFAKTPFPFLHLAITGYTTGLILTILFCFMVAHEIMASFVSIASQSGAKPLRDFLIISTIYLANVLITCLHEMGTIQWNFIYVNAYLLLTISGIIGLWGFRQRENLYENIMAFAPLGAIFYIAFATICFTTIGQLFGNANDAALKVVKDMIIFTHTAFGIVFLMYIFSNFMAMIADRLSVSRILYKPNRMPYFTFRLAGVIVTLAFVFVSHWRDYVNNSVAGFYTYAADLYMMQDNETFGRALYERSRINSFENHRANYALGMIKASRIDFDKAEKNFEQANKKNATDFSLVNQGNLHLYFKDYFPAIRQFHEAYQLKPSSPIENNLGFTYSKIHNLDSATYFLGRAQKDNLTKSSAEKNFFALVTSEYIPVKADSILGSFKTDDVGVIANALAAATLFRQDFKEEIDPLQYKILDVHSATLLNNYIIRNSHSVDSSFANSALRIARDTNNISFAESIKSALSHAYYQQGNLLKAQQILSELIYLDQSSRGKYNYIQGLWALEQGNPALAKSFFAHAGSARYKKARLYYAIAATENGNRTESAVAWDSVSQFGDSSEKQIALKVKRILNLSPQEALTATDGDKYQYNRYVLLAGDTSFFRKLSNTFDNQNYKAQALLDMSKKQFANGNLGMARRFFNQISGLELTDKNLYNEVRHYELKVLALQRDIPTLANLIKKGIPFDGRHALDKIFYEALIYEANGNIPAASKNYEIVGFWNPFYEDGIIAAADFFRRQDAKSIKPYTILSEAIQLNNSSIRLMEEYVKEATRQGLDEYATSAGLRLQELRANQ
jgi:tetratricopeptide (TPR) repeat protein